MVVLLADDITLIANNNRSAMNLVETIQTTLIGQIGI